MFISHHEQVPLLVWLGASGRSHFPGLRCDHYAVCAITLSLAALARSRAADFSAMGAAAGVLMTSAALSGNVSAARLSTATGRLCHQPYAPPITVTIPPASQAMSSVVRPSFEPKRTTINVAMP